MNLSLTFGYWALALLPILIVIVLMLAFRWGGSQAGSAGWFMAVLVAWLFFGAGFDLLAVAHIKAVLLSLDVFFIIWMALLLFNISKEAGAMRLIGQAMPRLTDDRVMQSILVGWLLVTFLQGMGGFGVPVAVCAPILVGLGFTPIQAVAMASLGDGWSVNFGSLATSFQTLIAVTGLPGETLAPLSALILGIVAFPSGLLVVLIGNGWKSLKKAFFPVLVLTVIMGVTQYLLATNGLWTLGSTGAGVVGLAAALLMVRLPRCRNHHGKIAAVDPLAEGDHQSPNRASLSLLGYALLVVLAFAVNLIQPLNQFLNQVVFTLHFPAVETTFGWMTPAESGRVIHPIGHPGAILFYTCLISYLFFRSIGLVEKGSLRRILGSVVKSGVNSSLGILAMVGVASIMLHSGMTYLLAEGLAVSFSQNLYPVIAPFIGALGAFITGSNTNSNVLFAVLQQKSAQMLGLSVPLILAAQTAGASFGSVMAPAKVIVGCSTVGLSGEEGVVMRKIMIYGLIPIITVSLVTYIIFILNGT